MTKGTLVPSQRSLFNDTLVQLSRLITYHAFTHMSFSGGSATSFRLGDPPHALNEPVVLPQQIGREQGRAIRLGEMWEVVDFGEVEN